MCVSTWREHLLFLSQLFPHSTHCQKSWPSGPCARIMRELIWSSNSERINFPLNVEETPKKEIYSWAGIYFNDLKLIQVNILAFKFMISVHVTLQAILIFKDTFAKRTSLIETIHMGFYMSGTSTFLNPSFSTLNTLPDNLVVHPQNPIHPKFFLIIYL